MMVSNLTRLRDIWRQGRRWTALHPRLALALLDVMGLLAVWWLLTRPGALFGRQDGTWIRLNINHDLYVGLDPNYPPFAEWTPDQIVGLEADLAREIGRRLGAKTQILIMGYDGLYDSLYIGTVDMLIAGLRIDPGQIGWVYYTRPYFDAGQILVSRAETPVWQMRELDGKTVAVELASAGDQAARRWQRRLSSLTVVHYLLPDEALNAVDTGQADAALVDTVSARLYLKQHPGLVMAGNTVVPEEYRIAMRRENFRLTEAVECVLAEMQADGTLDAIIARWL